MKLHYVILDGAHSYDTVLHDLIDYKKIEIENNGVLLCESKHFDLTYAPEGEKLKEIEKLLLKKNNYLIETKLIKQRYFS